MLMSSCVICNKQENIFEHSKCSTLCRQPRLLPNLWNKISKEPLVQKKVVWSSAATPRQTASESPVREPEHCYLSFSALYRNFFKIFQLCGYNAKYQLKQIEVLFCGRRSFISDRTETLQYRSVYSFTFRGKHCVHSNWMGGFTCPTIEILKTFLRKHFTYL